MTSKAGWMSQICGQVENVFGIGAHLLSIHVLIETRKPGEPCQTSNASGVPLNL